MTAITRGRGALLLVLGLAATACGFTSADEHVSRGNQYAQQGKDREAIVEYRSAVQKDTQHGQAHFRLGLAYERTQDYGRAAQEYVTAAELMPSDVSAQIKSASMLLIGRQFDVARLVTERALRNDPENVVAQVLHANALAGLKQTGTALAAIQKAIALDPTRGETYGELAMFQLANGSPEQAEENLKRAVAALPNSAQTHLTLASLYWAQNRMGEAEVELKRSVEVEPNNFIGSRALATFYLGSNRTAEAEAHLARIAEVSRSSEARLALADYFITLGRNAEATTLLTVVAQQDDGYADARSRLAAIQYAAGQHAQAHALLDETTHTQPRASRPLLTKAQFLLVEHKTDDAIAKLKAAVAADERSVPAHFTLGSVYAGLQQPDLAAQEFNEILKFDPQSLPARMELARLHLSTGQPALAADLAAQVVKLHPESLDASFLLAKATAGKGEISRALAVLRPVMNQANERADVLALLGALNLAIGERETARGFFEQGVRAQPDAPEPLEGLVALDITSGNLAVARATAERRLASFPNNSRYLVLAARTYAAANDAARTESTLRKAIEADASNTIAYDMLGQLYLGQHKLEQALHEYDELARRDPRSVSAQTMAAVLLQALDRKDDARTRYERVLEINPQAPIAAGNLAWLYVEQNGNLDLALQLAQVAKERLPEQPDINDTLAWIYYRKDLPALALPPMRLSIERDPKNPVYQYHLGLIYMKTGDIDLAKTALERALTLNPTFDGAANARKALATLQ